MQLREITAAVAFTTILAIGGGHAAASSASAGAAAATATAAARPARAMPEPTVPPVSTTNPFLPEDRGIGECISAAPKPGCGSKARGGWRQYVLFAALVGALSFIGWRIVAGARRNQRSAAAAAAGARPPADPEPEPPGPPTPTTLRSPRP